MINLSTPTLFRFTKVTDNARPSALRKQSLSRSGLGLAFSLRAGYSLAGFSIFLGLTGCSQNSSQNQTAQSLPNSPSTPATPALSKSAEQDWNKVFGQWWKAWQKSTTTKTTPSPATTTTTPLVTINLNALATRHPAWKLANALESNRETSLDFAAIRAAGISSQNLRMPSFDVRLDNQSGSPGRVTSNTSPDDLESNPSNEMFTAPAQIAGLTIDGYERGAEAVTAQGLEALQTEAADRQSDSIENFLRAVAAREADARDQYSQIRRAALQNEVEEARSTPLPEIQTSLLSDEEQLQATNLRLQLLRNIFSTEDERRRAREQLTEILAKWQARLRDQEKERLALLQERRVEAPLRVQEAGELELRRDLEKLQQEQRAAIRLAWQQHQERVRQDFGEENARLGIILPAASFSAQSLSNPSTPGGIVPNQSSSNSSFDFLETNVRPMASQSPFSSSGYGGAGGVSIPATQIASGNLRANLASSERNSMIRALRAQAWREARKQAQSAARRFGWRWQPASSQSSSAPDRTREVVQWLSD